MVLCKLYLVVEHYCIGRLVYHVELGECLGSSAETVVVEKLINCTPLNTPLKSTFWKCILLGSEESPVSLYLSFCKSLFTSILLNGWLFFCCCCLFFVLPLTFSWMYLYPKIWTGQVGMIKYAVFMCTRVYICTYEQCIWVFGSWVFFFCHFH